MGKKYFIKDPALKTAVEDLRQKVEGLEVAVVSVGKKPDKKRKKRTAIYSTPTEMDVLDVDLTLG